ncbi:MAG: hypothetical protein JW820_14000 [Spirochaetales bacterium]|nr:hypothetical protein [Spirochaetales bacterium]
MAGCGRKYSGLPGVIAVVLAAVVVVALAASCSSIFDAAVDSMIDRETDKAVAQAEEDAEAAGAESGASAPKSAAGAIDPSVHRVAGVWENPDYDDEGRSARVVFSLNADRSFTYLAFDRRDGSGEVYEGTVVYLRTWIDEQGRSCGESTVTLNNGMSWNTLDRISVDGNTLEVQSGVRKIDPKGSRYSIYFRP